jgi:hypothetical protein
MRRRTALGVSLAACELPPPTGERTIEVAEGPEPNGNGPGDVPTIAPAGFPLLLLGMTDASPGNDAFSVVLAGPGTLTVGCQGDLNISVFDLSSGQGTQGGCASNLALHSDGDDVDVVISGPAGASYRVRLELTLD